MRKGQPFTPKYWIVHHVKTDDVYIQTASKTEEEAKAAAISLGLGRVHEAIDLESGLAGFAKSMDEDGIFVTDEDDNIIDPKEFNENLAVHLFDIRFSDYYSVDQENELTEAEYLVAVKAFKDLLAAQTTDSARALIIGTANKMRLDLITGDIL